MKTQTSLIVGLLGMLATLVSCGPMSLNTGTPSGVPPSTATPPNLHLRPTPTEFRLPYNDERVDSSYCQGHGNALPLSQAQGLTDDEIVQKVMERWLAYFYVPEAPGPCRIAGYRIDDIYYDAHALAPPVEPQGDIMRVVRFSVKLVQVPTDWLSFPGEVDEANWLHAVIAVAILRSDRGYTWQLATP